MEPKNVMPIPNPPKQPVAKASLLKGSLVKEWIDIQLTDGNVRNGHFYLRTVERLLPDDCIGGSNRAQAANSIRVQLDPGMLVETDIAGDKMILRNARGQIRDFFDRTQAKAGDSVRFGRIDHHDFVVTLQRTNATDL